MGSWVQGRLRTYRPSQPLVFDDEFLNIKCNLKILEQLLGKLLGGIVFDNLARWPNSKTFARLGIGFEAVFFKNKDGGQGEESSQNECVLVKGSYPFQTFYSGDIYVFF